MRSLLGFSLLLAAATVVRGPGPAFDHSAFDALLRAHVVEGRVDYDAFARAPEFKAYLASLDQAEPARLDPQEGLAYWINVYNAFTIELINRHQERTSIQNINKAPGAAVPGPWREMLVRAGGRTLHLDHVEHDIIRRQWKDPRIHFALVCAAVSCPPLRSEAYTGARLDTQLADQGRRFLLHSPAQNRVELQAGTLYGSPIFVEYYREDFGQTDAAIARYLASFFPDGPEKELLLSGRAKLVATEYDWTLNSQAIARERSVAPALPSHRGSMVPRE